MTWEPTDAELLSILIELPYEVQYEIKDSLESVEDIARAVWEVSPGPALEAYVRTFALCGCCEEEDECLEGCTFSVDCPDEYAEMEAARRALRGESDA